MLEIKHKFGLFYEIIKYKTLQGQSKEVETDHSFIYYEDSVNLDFRLRIYN